MMKRLAVVAVMLFSFTAPAVAQPVQIEKHVTTLVVVKTPTGVTRSMIEAGFVKAAPMYQKVPGLLRKYFTVNDNGFGGMYLWESRAAADAWYSPEWRARSKATYGVEPEVTYFDSPLQIDNTPSMSK
jgi:hypothetical protein